jgi:hypothetical protein
MMNHFIKILICFVLVFSFSIYSKPAMALDAKVKVLASTSAYGAAGGALLGFASMAFGTTASSIAKGASLGLYAGILFGSYVVISHYYRPQYEAPYEDSESPYESGDGAPYDSKKGGSSADEQAPQLHERAFQLNQMNLNYKPRQAPPVYLDLIRWEF